MLDISEPNNLKRISYVMLPALIEDIAISNGYIYVVSGDLQVFDITIPTQSQLVGSFQNPGTITNMAIHEGYAYLGVGNLDGYTTSGGLWVIDVSDPAHPKEVYNYRPTGFTPPSDIAIANEHVYVAMTDSIPCLRIFDISDPANPIERTSPQTYLLGHPKAIVVSGHYAYVTEEEIYQNESGDWNGGLQIFDISDPGNPTQIGSFAEIWGASRVSMLGNVAYVTYIADGLVAIDVSNPSQPVQIGSYDMPYGNHKQVVIKEGQAFVSNGSAGIEVINISEPENMTHSGTYAPLGNVQTLQVADSTVYALDNDKLQILDVSNPEHPAVLGTHLFAGYDFTLWKDYALISGYGEMQVVNISQPSNPVMTGSYLSEVATYRNVIATDNFAYLNDLQTDPNDHTQNSTLKVLDLTNPTTPIEIGSLQAGWITDMKTDSQYVYLAGTDLRVIDISTPSSPVQVGTYQVESSSFALAEQHAYLGGNLFSIMDVSNPTTPILVGQYDIPWQSSSIAVGEKFALSGQLGCQADPEARDVPPALAMIDISDKSNPYCATSTDLPAVVIDIAINGDKVYLATGAGGLYILEFQMKIDGRIMDVNGKPISGVSLEAGTAGTTTSDANGNYQFNDLPDGTYEITPKKPGYIFEPPSRQVSVPPAASDVNFVMLSEPVSVKLEPGTPKTLAYTDTQDLPTSFAFPSDAVNATTNITVTPNLAPDQIGQNFAGHAFELVAYQNGIQQSEFKFNASITVTIQYSEEDSKLITDPSLLTLQFWNGSTWSDASLTCTPEYDYSRDIQNRQLSIPICRTGKYALYGPSYSIFLPLITHQAIVGE